MAAESDTELDAEAGEALDRLFADAHADVATRGELGRVAERLGIQSLGDSIAPPAAKLGVSKLLLAGVGSALVLAAGYVVVSTRSSEPASVPGASVTAFASSTPQAEPEGAPAEPAPGEQPAPTAAAGTAKLEPQRRAPLVATSVAEEAPQHAVATSTSASAAEVEPAPLPSAAPAVSELGLLRSARAEVASSPARALELVREHETLFPQSKLAQEREVVAIEALLKLGQRNAAETRAQSFEHRFPGSAYRAKLDALFGRK